MPVPVNTVRRVRDLTISYFYADMKDHNGDQEVLKISRKRVGRIESACIPRRDLWRVLDTDWQARQVPKICEQLYGMVTKPGCINVMHAIEEGIEDLHRYPPTSMGSLTQELEAMARDGIIISKNGTPLNA
ncbi:hypothetical protein [Dokdonella soli]|uniref:Uncharacterized protein n=1 Tax=Dokdonella soli TaxID=529810 RepID=A0ABN1IU12_9GAMM